jgi:hypothetical protein
MDLMPESSKQQSLLVFGMTWIIEDCEETNLDKGKVCTIFYLKLTPKTPELLVEMPLAAPGLIDVPRVESQRAAHLGFVLHTPALKLEESMHPAHQL